MDGITKALSAIQPALKPATEVANLGSTAYNMYNQYQNQKYQNQLRDLSSDPAKMNAYAEQFTKPLTAGLQTSVANQAQADLATRGLTDSPQISQEVYAQALAPWVQQNQQQGYSNALQALQVGGGAISPSTSSANTLSALTKAFSQLGGAGGGNAALQRLLQLARSGGVPQTTSPDLGGINPTEPQTLDLSGFYQPDYATAGGGDTSNPYAES